MNRPESVVRLPNDLGGVPAGPIARIDHPMQPWEKRCHALADVLDARKLVSTEEKRRGVEALGAQLIGALTYYERWAVCFAQHFFAKGVLTPKEVADRMEILTARLTEMPH